MIFLTITFELGIILQNIRRRVVGIVLINISPSNILPIMLYAARYHQNCQAVLAAVSINGLRELDSSLGLTAYMLTPSRGYPFQC